MAAEGDSSQPRKESSQPIVTTPILLTNDDGYDAEGLLVLWKAAKAVWGDNIRVAAPKRCWSQKSHATKMGPDNPIRVEPLDHELMEGVVVDGYPADCVRLALEGLGWFEGQRPLVLAGVNPGGNLGMDVYYSGTVAAVREGVALGCPGIAVSQVTYKDVPTDWDRTLEWAVTVLDRLKSFVTDNDPVLWNVNFPGKVEGEEMPRVRVVPMSTDPLAVSFEKPDGGDGSSYVYNGPYFDRPAAPNTDVGELFAGNITVTPLGLDHTCDRSL
jgi:5'/3'-nucleotidase